MPAQNLARLALVNGFRRGENGWGEDAFNYNFNKLSSLIHISIKQMNKSAPSSNDPIGTAYIVANNPSGVFASNAGDIAYRDLTSPAPVSGTSPAKWYFQRPFTGMVIYNETDNLLYRYDNGWAAVRPPFTGGRWYKTIDQRVNTDNTSTIVWQRAEYQKGVSEGSNILNISDSGYYDIRLQTTSRMFAGHGQTFSRIRDFRSGHTLAEASTYAHIYLDIIDTNNCSWQGYLAASSKIDFTVHVRESPTTISGGYEKTFFECKRID